MPLSEDDKKWIKDQLEDMETKLLTEFHKWASPMDARVRSHTAVINAMDLELEEIKKRFDKPN